MTNIEYQYVSKRLKQLMNLRRCNVKQLAEASGVSSASIYKVRQCSLPLVSKPTIEMLEKALGAKLILENGVKEQRKLSAKEYEERCNTISSLEAHQKIRLLLLVFENQKLLASELGVAEITLSKVYSSQMTPRKPVADKITSLALAAMTDIDKKLYELFIQTLEPHDYIQNRIKNAEEALIEETFLSLHEKYNYPLQGLHIYKRFSVSLLKSRENNNSSSSNIMPDIVFMENNEPSLIADIWCIDSKKGSKLGLSGILTRVGAFTILNASILVIVTLTDKIVFVKGKNGIERVDDIPSYEASSD